VINFDEMSIIKWIMWCVNREIDWWGQSKWQLVVHQN